MIYKQPPLSRGVNPLKMNWLWRLICEAGYISADDVVSALESTGVQLTHERALGWIKSEGDHGYFPLSIAEIEQNLRAILVMRSTSLRPGEGHASE